jgi:cytochrome P450
MREAMRLHPGVSMPLERVVPSGGATICDVTLPAGTVVGVNPAVVHYDTEIYGADAAEFRPERWLESSDEQLKAMNRCFLAVRYPHLVEVIKC